MGILRGDDNNPLDELRSQFANLSSIDIIGTYTCLLSDPSAKNPVDEVKVHLREQGDRYWFEAESIHGQNKILPESMIWAFNGTNAQYFDHQRNLLSLKKGQLLDTTFSAILFHPLSEYIPFYPYQHIEKNGYLERITDFNDPVIWQKSVGHLLPATQSFWKGSNLISFDCKAIGEGSGGRKLDLRFGLDPSHSFIPMIWERWDAGKLITSSEVLNIASFNGPGGHTFYFPNKSKFTWFKPDGSPALQIDFQLSSLVLGKHYTDDDFTIDPGTANMILDVDANKIIQVPH